MSKLLTRVVLATVAMMLPAGRPAQAQEVASLPGRVALVLESTDEPATISVVSSATVSVVGGPGHMWGTVEGRRSVCVTPCTLLVFPGRIKVRAGGPELADRDIEVEVPYGGMHVRFQPVQRSSQRTYIALLATGIPLMGIGALATLGGIGDRQRAKERLAETTGQAELTCIGCDSPADLRARIRTDEVLLVLGPILAAAGIGLTIGGAVVRSRAVGGMVTSPYRDRLARTERAPHLSLSLTGAPGGVQAVGTLRF